MHEDGSWEYKSESYTMTTKADGTWEWTNNKGDKANLNADGTWESFDAQRNERVPVNPIAYAEGGVGGNSVVPLKPRTPLKPGEKAQ